MKLVTKLVTMKLVTKLIFKLVLTKLLTKLVSMKLVTKLVSKSGSKLIYKISYQSFNHLLLLDSRLVSN